MKKYSSYIFLKASLVFLGLILVLVSLIWFSKVLQFVRFVTDYGITVPQFLSLFILILPWLSLFLIPVSLFVSILMVYNRLINNNEITILKNSGLSNLSIAAPVLPLVIICTICSFLVSFYLMPYANKNLRLARMEFEDNYSNLSFRPGIFETVRTMTIYVENRDNNKLSGILVNDNSKSEYALTVTAKNGVIVTGPNSGMLYMQDGTVQKFNYKTKKTDILKFDSYSFNLAHEHKDHILIRWRPNERYLDELLYPEVGTSIEELQKYKSEFHQRITIPLFSLVLSIIALSSILRGQFNRKGNLINILLAILLASIFIIAAMNLYNFNHVLILYFNLILFSAIGLFINHKSEMR